MGTTAAVRKLVGARELKTRLGKYLRAVRSGSTITITERGVPVARLSPVLEDEEGIDAVLSKLEDEGILSKASGRIDDDGKPLMLRGEPIERTIARDREERL